MQIYKALEKQQSLHAIKVTVTVASTTAIAITSFCIHPQTCTVHCAFYHITRTHINVILIYRVGQKITDHFLKCITPVYNDLGRRSIYKNVQLFFRSNTDIVHVATFKCSLHKLTEMIIPLKIPIKLSKMFNYCTQFTRN